MIRITYIILFTTCFFNQSCTEDNGHETTADIRPDTTLIDIQGLLEVNGNRIVNKNNEPVSLAGNSFFWSNDGWGGEKYYNSEVVSWLKEDWNTSIVRASMGVEDPGGYLDNKTANKDRVKIIIDAAIQEGIYVIVDWHSHHAEDYVDEAIIFFEEIASLYGDCLLYTSPSPRD